MSEMPVLHTHVATPVETTTQPSGTLESPRRRWLALGVVLLVSFGHFIATSTYYAIGGPMPTNAGQHQWRLVGALIEEIASLSVLWYVLSGQGRSWKDIGWKLQWMDVPRAAGLLLGSTLASYLLWIPVQTLYYSYSGHYLTPKSLQGMLGFGISGLSIAFVCLNPFFEELIVRGYLMSEITALGGNGALAILISVAVQMSYHLYQGFTNGIVLVSTFAVFSVYFSRSRRIAPVVLAHFCMDAYALIHRSV